MRYVYVLRCHDSRSYIGSTDNLNDRLVRHSKGYVPATQQRLPIRLLAYFAFIDNNVAYKFEKYLKSGSGRAFLNRHVFLAGIELLC